MQGCMLRGGMKLGPTSRYNIQLPCNLNKTGTGKHEIYEQSPLSHHGQQTLLMYSKVNSQLIEVCTGYVLTAVLKAKSLV